MAGGLVFFWRSDDQGLPQVWRSDGTIAGTIQLTAIETGASPSAGYFLVALGDEVFFPVMLLEGHHNVREQIWRSDGTAQGTRPAFEPPGGRVPSRLTPAGGALYFAVWMNTSPQTTYEIWRSDGTTAGTERLLPQSMVLPSAGAQFTAAGGAVYFVVVGPAPPYMSELWRADAAGAIRVDTFGTAPVGLFELEGLLYFFLRGTSGWELWRSDGTTAGTVRVDTLPDPKIGLLPPETAVVDGRLFLLPRERATGGLWVSDGAPGTLRRLADFASPQFAGTSLLAAAGGRLHFVGHDPAHGYELWVSDGTEAGTRLLHDLAPGAASSHPFELTAAGSRVYFSADDGVHGRELWVLDLGEPAGVCLPSSTALCLGGRFRAEAAWRAQGQSGEGRTVPLTADTGAFWFFGPENLEVILKVLDGRGLNQHHWVFYGALSSVEYALTVTDVQTGLTARYWNPSGQLASVADTTGFGPLGAFSVVERSTSAPPPRVRAETAAAAGPCQPAPTRLCLHGGRFAVEATWKDFAGNTGVGTAVPLTGDTGYFWFFGADNVEVMLKVLDGTAVNGKHWVFYGALSSVEYTLRVTDTATGTSKTYTNRSGDLASVADTGAF